jgi:hypothetical protein
VIEGYTIMDGIQRIIQKLNLKSHPEGGYYRETYRGALQISEEDLGEEYSGKRNCSTCIYFLLTSYSFSSFHRIRQDEIWHFYKGSPLLLYLISPEGIYSVITIGNNLEDGQLPQFVVPGGYWFAAATISDNGYSLVGCTVSPGFDFNDFELGEKEELTSIFPQHQKIIEQFTRTS